MYNCGQMTSEFERELREIGRINQAETDHIEREKREKQEADHKRFREEQTRKHNILIEHVKSYSPIIETVLVDLANAKWGRGKWISDFPDDRERQSHYPYVMWKVGDDFEEIVSNRWGRTSSRKEHSGKIDKVYYGFTLGFDEDSGGVVWRVLHRGSTEQFKKNFNEVDVKEAIRQAFIKGPFVPSPPDGYREMGG